MRYFVRKIMKLILLCIFAMFSVRTGDIFGMQGRTESLPFLAVDYTHQPYKHADKLEDFIQASLVFLTQKCDQSPVATKKHLAAGASQECVDAIVRKCMGMALAKRSFQSIDDLSRSVELDILNKKGKKISPCAFDGVEPFTARSLAIASAQTQKQVAEFLARAVKGLYGKNFLVTQRLFLWATDSQELSEWDAALYTEYALEQCSPLFKELAHPESGCRCHCCLIL